MGSFKGVRSGYREDLGIRVRSRWEANVGRWLQWRQGRGEILRWAYEPRVFIFHGVTRGCVQYTPDFRLVYLDGSEEYIEVKGRELSRDRTKWKRMAKFYPHVKFSVIGEAEYRVLCQQHGGLAHWEY